MIGCYGLIHRHLTCHKRLNNYKIIGRNSKDLGSTRIVCKKESTTICSESTKATMQSVVSSLIKNTQSSNASRILDIGSGLGQLTMHCYIHPGVALSYGIEVSILRHVWAIENLEKVLEADWTNKTNKIFLAHGNISDAKTLDPFTHIYSYNIG